MFLCVKKRKEKKGESNNSMIKKGTSSPWTEKTDGGKCNALETLKAQNRAEASVYQRLLS